MLGNRTCNLHIFQEGSVSGAHYSTEILLPYVRVFRGAMGLHFLFMDGNASNWTDRKNINSGFVSYKHNNHVSLFINLQ